MEKIYVYSKTSVNRAAFGALAAEETASHGSCLYTLFLNPPTEDGMALALDFIFDALIESIVEKRFKINKHICCGKESLSVFSQKLSAYLYITGNRSKIDDIVRSLIEQSGIINIEGVVTFRLRELSNDISAFFDLLFYEYNVKKQYDDFVSLVRDYIRLEIPKEQIVHVVFERRGFKLFNTKKENVTDYALKKYKIDSASSEGSLNDFLISSLLYFLPKKIILHLDDKLFVRPNTASMRIIETIKTIFEHRVISCESADCELCGSAAANTILC